MQTIDRAAFIEKAAELTAQCLYDIHEGRGDTSMMEVNGEIKMKPFLPVIAQVIGRPDVRNTSISDAEGNCIDLSVTEEEDLQARTNAHLAALIHQRIRAGGPDTPAVLFEAAKGLINRAQQIGNVVLIGMNTAKQQKLNKSRDFVIVAPYAGKGETLMMPEPSTTGQKYAG
jgi:hypothetical protein